MACQQEVTLNGSSVVVIGNCVSNVTEDVVDVESEPDLDDDDFVGDDKPTNKAFEKADPVIADFDGFCNVLRDIYEELKPKSEGALWDLLEEQTMRCEESGDKWCMTASLAAEKWGLSVCTVDGYRFDLGDATECFSMQDASKIITYLMTVSELGQDTVHRYQGKEPSGRRRNEIVLDHHDKPHNPLTNAGGIMSAALILQLLHPERTGGSAAKYEEVFQFAKSLCGGECLGFNNSLFLRQTRESMDSEYELAYLMRRRGCFPPGITSDDIGKIVEFYFQLRCLDVTCSGLSTLGAILAASTSSSSSGGMDKPTTFEECDLDPSIEGGRRLLASDAIRNALSLLYSCGMADYSGQFAFNCGLPAISSMSDSMLLVIPGVAGIALWSPPLDQFHNSNRAVKFCQKLVQRYTLHRFSGIGVCRKHLRLPATPKSLHSEWTCEHDRRMQIMLAAAYGDVNYLKTAFFRGVDFSSLCDTNGRTPLHLSAAAGYVDCAEFLLNIAGADPNAKDAKGATPKNIAEGTVVEIFKRFEEDNETQN